MCSVHDMEDREVQNFVENEKINQIEEYKCRKCLVNNAAIKLRSKDFYCKECFLIAVTHKFRATLGKSKIVKSTDTILMGFSGSSRSSALLHLIKAGMHESVHKRLVFQIKVFFIDEGSVKHHNIDRRQQVLEEINNEIKNIGFEAFASSLSEVLDSSIKHSRIDKIDSYKSWIDENNKKDVYLSEIFDKLPSHTSKIDFIKKLRYQMLIKAAKKLGCTKIFVGDDAHSLAVDILSNVSLGRGSQLSSDIGFVDQRDPDIMILRPLKDFSRHEVEFYTEIHGLVTVDTGELIPSISNNAYSSIQQLTNLFINDLETRFSGTVSTVFRTGEKMAETGNIKNNKNCVFCSGALDSKPLDNGISATDATIFSRLISLQGSKTQVDVKNHVGSNLIDFSGLKINHVKNDAHNCNGKQCNCDPRTKSSDEWGDVTIKNVDKFLCYGCRLIYQCNFSLDNVPQFVLNRCKEKLCLENMKKQITDFLL